MDINLFTEMSSFVLFHIKIDLGEKNMCVPFPFHFEYSAI